MFTINNDSPIERYYKVAERVRKKCFMKVCLPSLLLSDSSLTFFIHCQVLEQFLATSIRRGTTDAVELFEPYLVGNRLVKFLSMVLPTHPAYFDGSPGLRLQSQEQLVKLLEYLEQLSQIIDELEYKKHMVRGLTRNESDLVRELTAGCTSQSLWTESQPTQAEGMVPSVQDHELRSVSLSSASTKTPVGYVDVGPGSVDHSTDYSVLTQSVIEQDHQEDPPQPRVAQVAHVTEAFSEAYEKKKDASSRRIENNKKSPKQLLRKGSKTLHPDSQSLRPPSPEYSDPSLQQVSLPSIEPSSAPTPRNDQWEADDFSDFDFGPAEGSTIGIEPTQIYSVDLAGTSSFMVEDESQKHPQDIEEDLAQDDPSTTCCIDFEQDSSKNVHRIMPRNSLEEPSIIPRIKLAEEPMETYPMDFATEHTGVRGTEESTKTEVSPKSASPSTPRFIPMLKDPPARPSREIRARAAASVHLNSPMDSEHPADGKDTVEYDGAGTVAKVMPQTPMVLTTQIEKRLELASSGLDPVDVMDQPQVDAYFEAWRRQQIQQRRERERLQQQQQQQEQQLQQERRQQQQQQQQLQQQQKRIIPMRQRTAFEYNPLNPFNDDNSIAESDVAPPYLEDAVVESSNRGILQHFKGCVKCLLD